VGSPEDRGAVERTTLTFQDERLATLELPCFVARGPHDGPALSLIAGIHGCEYSSIAGVTRFMRSLDTSELRGTITAVPIVSLSSFRARTPFVVPEDGKNLNRCFPGTYEGTFTDALARAVFDALIEQADVLIDLHGGDQVEDLAPFTLYDASPVEGEARSLAIAFGLPYVLRSAPSSAPIGGTTSSAAAAAGVPAVIAEVGGRGLLEESAVRMHVGGLERALRQLEMLPGEADEVFGQQHVGRFVWLRAGVEGWWEPSVEAGALTGVGERLGVVRNLYGDVVEEVVSPEAGVVLFLTTSPAVTADGLLLGLGADIEPID
jgi:predicted deacylase